ncbi:MAG TPA: DUF1499 domain-containing protein [Stellaceae bacterium]|jgi:uncharacterized protein (DUF1499 family)|nr:DUF1499 domain-containing protein [Stellaceae bacterium]
MSIATTSSAGVRSSVRYLPYLALILAMIAVLLLALGPVGWRAGWWHFRFGLLTLMPWAAYSGIAALIVAAVALLLGRSRLEWRGLAFAVLAFAVGGLIAYVPWHYDQIRKTVPPIHDITTDPDNPPAFVAAVQVRTAQGINPVTYEGAKIAAQQRQAYPDIAPLIVKSPPDTAFDRALDAARRMGWSIVAADKAAGRIEATDRSRWFGFTDDIVIRVAATDGGSRIDLRSSSRLGRSDFGVNAARVRAYLALLREGSGGPG